VTETEILSLEPGDTIEWPTWCGTGTAVVRSVDVLPSGTPLRVFTYTDGLWWEATCFKTLAESMKKVKVAL